MPTVFNVAFDFRYNWDGKYKTLEEHLSAPLMSPVVMNGGGWKAVVARLERAYASAFFAAGYRDGVTRHGIESAIAIYQRSLTTPDAKFDRYLRGETQLSDRERAGYEIFKNVGCITCHQGINVGGNLFQRFGVMADALDGRQPTRLDMGRFLVTGKQRDMRVFRVPSLRNVALTAPYFHDGSAATLDDAVRHMGRVQLGYILTEHEVHSIVAFLETLTGRQPGTRR